MNPYLKHIENALPKLIAMVNMDPESKTFGFADRQFWAWKTTDFPNGTYQGVCHTFSVAIKLNLLEKELGLKLINACILALPKIQNPNGSVEEAYPREDSFCVTALVAFDCLSAIEHLGSLISKKEKKELLNCIRPLISFISKNDETHAIISNHLATGVAAIWLWNKLLGEDNPRGDELLKIILDNQSKEGWYLEYQGADPGYQTLCTYYLSAALKAKKDVKLIDSLNRSLDFLQHFIHPDGTIGGIYGSRNTEVFYPGGISSLANEDLNASFIENIFLENGVSANSIFPDSIDRENLIPLINSFSFAALHFKETQKPSELGFTSKDLEFEETGLKVFSNDEYLFYLNYKKGGVFKLFNLRTKNLDAKDHGLILEKGKKSYNNQVFDEKAKWNGGEIKSSFFLSKESYPSHFQFLLIRFFTLTIFRFRFLRESFKSAVVNLLITGKSKMPNSENLRKVVFEKEKVLISDSFKATGKYKLKRTNSYKAIHMASSGYSTGSSLIDLPSSKVEYNSIDT